MGYRRAKTTYRLVFEGEEAGLEVVCRSASIGTYLKLAVYAQLDLANPQVAMKHLAEVDELLKTFADIIVEWNLEDETGVPVPPTADGLFAQDLSFTKTVLVAWLRAVVSVPDPLASESSSGDLSLEASIPMDISSPSLSS